jgi:hypothetical protein
VPSPKPSVMHIPERLPLDWAVSQVTTINGRRVERRQEKDDTGRWQWWATELSIRGESGRFRFVQHVLTETAEWIDVIGGPVGSPMWRSFYLDRVKTVHRISRTRVNAELEGEEEESG